MKLYGSETSPFVRKCRITALEAGLGTALNFQIVNVMDGASGNPNPLKLIPTLVTEAGDMIVDSRVICDYLAAHGSGLTVPEGWADRTLVALADGLMDRAVSLTLERRRPEADQSTDWQDRWVTAIREALPELERRLPAAFTPGAIALTCALGYLDFRFADLAWREGRRELARWYETQLLRQSVQQTEPPR
jgi:glutathione S-transferase